jgi:hypothetical protein
MDLNFYLRFPGKEAARNAALTLRGTGFKATGCRKERGRWVCAGMRKVAPTDAGVARVVRALKKTARRLGGRYDGWTTV